MHDDLVTRSGQASGRGAVSIGTLMMGIGFKQMGGEGGAFPVQGLTDPKRRCRLEGGELKGRKSQGGIPIGEKRGV